MFNWFRKSNQEWRQSPKWIKAREASLKRDNNACVMCGKRNNLHVHHTYSSAWYPRHRYNVQYLVTLCVKHHAGAHAYMGGTRKRGTPAHFEAYRFYVSQGGRLLGKLSLLHVLLFVAVSVVTLFLLVR